MLIAEITSPMGPSNDKHILLDVKIMEINECSFFVISFCIFQLYRDFPFMAADR